MLIRKNIVGKKFNRLTVVSLSSISCITRSESYWLCRCDCGVEKIISRSNLCSGHTKSCGCLRREQRNHRIKSLLGRRYGMLVVISALGTGVTKRSLWEVRCDCGKTKSISGSQLQQGHTKSCGCSTNVTHGLSVRKKSTKEQEKTYGSWADAKRRCAENHKDYGARGIKMCERWQDSYECFLSDMGGMAKIGQSLERIDVNGNYEPGNCKWASREEQAANKRNTKLVMFDGQEMLLSHARHLLKQRSYPKYPQIRPKLRGGPNGAIP